MKKYALVKHINGSYEIITGDISELHDFNKYSSVVCADTLEQLKATQKILDVSCKKCNGPIGTNYSNAKDLIDNQLCFTCLFWKDVLSENKNNQFIINGNVYTKSNNVNEHPKGFGGRKFKIQRLDTHEIIETDNLWHRGKMTKWYKIDNPDTAKFI